MTGVNLILSLSREHRLLGWNDSAGNWRVLTSIVEGWCGGCNGNPTSLTRFYCSQYPQRSIKQQSHYLIHIRTSHPTYIIITTFSVIIHDKGVIQKYNLRTLHIGPTDAHIYTCTCNNDRHTQRQRHIQTSTYTHVKSPLYISLVTINIVFDDALNTFN